ncbi:uncharacterized protein YBL113C-like [Protopterus annectens]|uniref:uncharacterized protein YBL113C-like n=1 Tax=Protopterus annectens TaxID=7888 RepID=UPI001CF959D5|nr:uncharacterized protein YBL113C-like [Protopterus annectens]
MENRKSQSDLFKGILLFCITILLKVPASDTTTETTTGTSETATTSSSFSVSSMTDPAMNTTSSNSTTYPTISMTGTPLTTAASYNITCQSFSCINDSCYKNQTTNQTCTTSYYCELFRHSLTNYTAGCSMTCGGTANICKDNNMTRCTQECCNTANCLKLNGMIQELTSKDSNMTTMAMTTANSTATTKTATTTTTTTTTTPTTTKAPTTVATTTSATTTAATTSVSYNGKICKTFTCNGTTCYQGKTTTDKCKVGYEYCELRKKFLSANVIFVAGCSTNCDEDSNVCTSTSTKDCLLECCSATTDCLRLDGEPHTPSNTSPAVTMLFIQILSWSVLTVICNMHVTSFLHI